MRVSEFSVLTFDTYGTLIDWETGIWQALAPMLSRLSSPPVRESALAAFAESESRLQAERPSLRYSELLAEVHAELAGRFGAPADVMADRRFGDSVGDWPAFADARESLAWLKGHFRLVTLTNCDRASYRGSAARLGDPWNVILTAEDVGSYKPDPRNFAVLLETVAAEFGCGPGEILHVAQSLFHDHAPAKDAGLATLWIDRRGGRAGGATAPPPRSVEPDLRLESMAELVARHRAELAGSAA